MMALSSRGKRNNWLRVSPAYRILEDIEMKAAFLLAVLTAVSAAEPVSLEYDLSGWVSIALQNSPEITISDAGLQTAEAGLLSARSFLWPSLDLRASAGHVWTSSQFSGDYDDETYSASVTLSQELLNSGGSSWLRLSGSAHEITASELDYRSTILDLMLNVLIGYYSVVEAVELREAADHSLERSQRQLEKTQALYDLGAMTTLELIQAQVQESRDALTLSQREEGIYIAYTSLYEYTGIQPGDTVYTVSTLAVLEPVSSETARSFNLDISGNPTLLASTERLAEARLSSEADSRLYWPSLSASGSWSWNDNRFHPGDIPDEDSWNVSMSLTWNVFDGWYRESRIKSSRSSLLRSEAVHRSLENSLNTRLMSAYETLLISIRNYELSALTYDYSREQLDLSALTYDLGGLSLLDLLDAQQTLAEAEATLVSARVACLEDEARLMVLLGRTPRLGE
jgi:outer membrane protein